MKNPKQYEEEAQKYYASKRYSRESFVDLDENREGELIEGVNEDAIERAIKQAYIDGLLAK